MTSTLRPISDAIARGRSSLASVYCYACSGSGESRIGRGSCLVCRGCGEVSVEAAVDDDEDDARIEAWIDARECGDAW